MKSLIAIVVMLAMFAFNTFVFAVSGAEGQVLATNWLASLVVAGFLLGGSAYYGVREH